MNLSILKFKIKNKYSKIVGHTIYDSYETALKSCVNQGYENELIIQSVKNKAIQWHENERQNPTIPHVTNTTLTLLATILQLNQQGKPIYVVDFGGGEGNTYFLLKKVLDPNIPLYWFVVETKAMAQGLQSLSNEYLSFHDDLALLLGKLGAIDILYTSGTIQYTPDPYYFLKLISDSKARFKIFNRQSLNVGNKDLWTVQSSRLSWHGGTELQLAGVADREIRYPHVNIALAHFEKIVTETNRVLYTFEEQSGVQKVNKENIIGKSYVMERKI